MAYPDVAIGAAILEAAWHQDKELTSLQLVKLAFIGNGFWLAQNVKPLI